MRGRTPGPLGSGGKLLGSIGPLGTRPLLPTGVGSTGLRDAGRARRKRSLLQHFGQNVAKDTISIAFVTKGDAELTPAWESYAKRLVGDKGQVFLVDNIKAAAEAAKNLPDGRVANVFFVGHGVAAKGKKAGTFMLHGHRNAHGAFVTAKLDELVDGSAQSPLFRALAPKLSTSKEVLVSFAACYSGQGGLLQDNVAQVIVGRAPKVRVRVEGYAAYFETKKDGSDARLSDDKTKTKTEAVKPPKRPALDVPAATRAGRDAAPDRTFDNLNSRDPLEGL